MLYQRVFYDETEFGNSELGRFETQGIRALGIAQRVPYPHVAIRARPLADDVLPHADRRKEVGGTRSDRRHTQRNVLGLVEHRPPARVDDSDAHPVALLALREHCGYGQTGDSGSDDDDVERAIHSSGTPRDNLGSRPASPIMCLANAERTPGTRSKPSMPRFLNNRTGGLALPNRRTIPSVMRTSLR